MRNLLRLCLCVCVLLPSQTYAVSNDAQLSAGSIIAVGADSFVVSGTTAQVQSLAVGASSFDVTLEASSTLTIVSSGMKTLTVTTNPNVTATFTCGSTNSTLALSGTGLGTVTVTPGATCASSSGGSGGGGGGGGGTAPAPAPAPASPPPAPTPTTLVTATTEPVAQLPAPELTQTLALGSTGAEVVALQEFLVARGFLVMPPGVAYGYFGLATQSAVIAFQKSMGLEPVGIVGTKTRAAISSWTPPLPNNTTLLNPTTATTTVYIFKTTLHFGSTGDEVKELQKRLTSLNFYNGPITGYFGSQTSSAVRRFQEANNLRNVGSGIVGPETRAVLNKTSLTISAESRMALIRELLAMILELQKQLAALKSTP